jgi:hypothetical protein
VKQYATNAPVSFIISSTNHKEPFVQLVRVQMQNSQAVLTLAFLVEDIPV